MTLQQKHLQANQLALYLGCECWYADGLVFELCGIIDILGEYHAEGRISSNKTSAYPLHTIKPILRPLSDMTNIEFLELQGSDLAAIRTPNPKYYNIISEGMRVAYLLSKHFDLFGWISQKLAIDKTTL